MVNKTEILGDLPDFSLKVNGPVSRKIVEMDIHRFHDAIHFVRNLKYGRNSSKLKLTNVIDEDQGTCSTKHALIKTILNEHEVNSIHLMLGIYPMNDQNTPGVGHVLNKYQLDYIPEAHNYLKYRETRYDYTFPGKTSQKIFEQLLNEIVIEPEQIAKFKEEYHQKFLRKWLFEQDLNTRFNLEAIWEIREECILHLCNKN